MTTRTAFSGGLSLPRLLVLLLWLTAAVVRPLAAQNGSTVSLRIRPRVGDTMYTRFEQEVEMTGTTRVGGADTTMTMTSNMLMLSHVLVQASDDRATTVLTITDSIAMATSGASRLITPESVRRALQGKRVRLRIAADGSATVLDASDELGPDLQAVVSGMPATLPGRPIPVGATWEKVMAIPVAGGAEAQPGATLHTVYRLDSLSADGDLAYISVRGTLTRDSTAAALPHGLRVTSTGNITGDMRVDRKRGWWSDSRATIAVKSIMTPSAGARTNPVQVQMKITQRMRTLGTP
jgi:Family of unknown function (DUF6263)